ncbi:MAG: hypothetical protein ABFS43_16275 [Thermodesulfobacteriota bacterium]
MPTLVFETVAHIHESVYTRMCNLVTLLTPLAIFSSRLFFLNKPFYI